MNGGRGIIKKTHFENKIIIRILDGFTSEKNKLLKIRKVLLDGDGPPMETLNELFLYKLSDAYHI